MVEIFNLKNKCTFNVFTVVHTFIFVCIQKVLELCVEDLQVFLDENLLTLPGQLILCAFVEVDLHPPLLLQQTSLSLQHKQHFSFTIQPNKV